MRQVADATGSPLLTQTFDPYGSLYARAGEEVTSFGFTGEQTDGNGLLYLRARYYAPSQGRFFQLDPSRQEVNPYQYSSSNPLNFTDPSGLSPEYPDMVEGREIHNRIERRFRSWGLSLGKEVDTEVYIQNASKQHVIRVYSEEDGFFALVEDPSEPVGNFGRADLVDFSAHQVYEIKHVRSWQYGYAEARWYQGRMELDPNPIFAGNWFLGDQFLTDGPKLISDWPDVSGNYSQDWELVADFSRNAPAGVIVYYAREKRNDEQPEWDFDPAIETLPLTTPYIYILLRGALKGCGSPSPQPVPQPGYGVFPPLIPFYILEQYLLPYYESVPS